MMTIPGLTPISPPASGCRAIGGTSGLIEGNRQQLLIQLSGVAVTLVWSAGVTFVLLKLVSAFVPLRVSREHELDGLDISHHGEALQ
jgi:ammonium transporter, Amt family